MRRFAPAAITILLVVAAVGGWLLFAPQPLGGPVAYVVTDGISMQPRLHEGDLVLVRRTAQYEVGDVAAYRSDELDRVVLHRIIGVDGDRFVFQGDNNDFVDGENPSLDQMVGKKWLTVPGAGKALAWVGQPRTAAILAGVIALILLSGFGIRRTKGRHQAPSSPRHYAGTASPLATALAITVVIAVVLWMKPATKPIHRQISYQVQGSFDYSADVERSAAYPEAHVTTGQPIFLRLVDSLSLSYEQRFLSDAPHSVSARGSMVAVLSDSSGWRHTEIIQAERDFQGDELELTGALDLRALSGVIERVQRLTEVQEPYYTLTIQPEVTVSGLVAGRPVTERVADPVVYQVDALRMKLLADEQAAPNSAPRDSLHPSRSGVVLVEASEPNVLTVAGRELSVEPLRMAVSGGAILLLILLAFALLRRRRPMDEPTRISVRYGAWLIAASSHEAGPPRKAVQVKSFEDLLRLAERYDRMIMHDNSDGIHSYVVEEQNIAYWYQYVSPGTKLRHPAGRENVHQLVPPRPETQRSAATNARA